MPTVRFTVRLPLPSWLYTPLKRAQRKFLPREPLAINIDGERDVEWSFLSREMPEGPGEALEFGCERAYMSLLAAQRGFHVVANDLQEQAFLWRHASVEFLLGDLLKLPLPSNHFDLAINCSSVEHVGVAGRYGIEVDQNEGDLEVMKRLAQILKPGGILLMTAPCGQDTVMAPWNRVYGKGRLPRLLAAFHVAKENYWMKDATNRWVQTDKKAALELAPRHDRESPHGCLYALGCFVLRKPNGILSAESDGDQPGA